MTNARGKIFCQRCKGANALGQDLCVRCGTRLMLVVEPTASRFEDGGTGGGMEEHLLERVTALENNLSRLIDKVGKMADLFLRHTRTAYIDHALLDTLVDVLNEAEVIRRKTVEAAWRKRYRAEEDKVEDGDEPGGPTRSEALCENIVSQFAGTDEGRDEFARLVREGFELMETGKTAAGVKSLERAAASDATNIPLNIFLGVHFFGRGRTALARDYLSRALEADSENGRVQLLLGLACGEEGEPERARELLSEAVRRVGPSFAAHCALGRLSAAEADWKTALAEFKRALAARPCPEAHYLLGLAYFETGRDRTALRHLTKAVRLDASYGAAQHLLGLVYKRLGERARATAAFRAARAAGVEAGEGTASGAASNRAAVAPNRVAGRGRARRRLVTGGDERLAAALQEDVLGKAATR